MSFGTQETCDTDFIEIYDVSRASTGGRTTMATRFCGNVSSPLGKASIFGLQAFKNLQLGPARCARGDVQRGQDPRQNYSRQHGNVAGAVPVRVARRRVQNSEMKALKFIAAIYQFLALAFQVTRGRLHRRDCDKRRIIVWRVSANKCVFQIYR